MLLSFPWPTRPARITPAFLCCGSSYVQELSQALPFLFPIPEVCPQRFSASFLVLWVSVQMSPLDKPALPVEELWGQLLLVLPTSLCHSCHCSS